MIGGGCQQDREGMLPSEQRDTRIQLRNVSQHLRTQAQVLVGLPIPPQGGFVTSGRGDEFPGHARHLCFSEWLKVGEAYQVGKTRPAAASGSGAGPAGAAAGNAPSDTNTPAFMSASRRVISADWNCWLPRRSLSTALEERKGVYPESW